MSVCQSVVSTKSTVDVDVHITYAALSPLRLRLGGTVQDEIVYDVGLSNRATQCLPLEKDDVNITGYRGGCLSMERWMALNNLFNRTG